jgi:hypothetical protein
VSNLHAPVFQSSEETMAKSKNSARSVVTLLIIAVGAILLVTQPAGSQFSRCQAAEEGGSSDKRPTIRIKAGSDEKLTDSAGHEWAPDDGFEGGETIARAADLKIENTKDPEIYRSERYSMESFSQDLPNGKYQVRLHFAETFDEITGPGGRVFSFSVNGQDFKDFDVAKKAGGVLRAYIEEVDVDVKDGKLKITFTPDVQNPEINGIEIIPLPEKKAE